MWLWYTASESIYAAEIPHSFGIYVYVLNISWCRPLFTVISGTTALTLRSRYLKNSETVTLVNAEEDLVDSGNSSHDEKEDAHNIGEDDADGADVSTDTWINYTARRKMIVGVSGPQDSVQCVTEIVDISELFLARNLLDGLHQNQIAMLRYINITRAGDGYGR
jgi:hypothetical protein